MSTRTEPYQKYVAHDEKSKFFIFFPEPMVGLETLCDFVGPQRIFDFLAGLKTYFKKKITPRF